MPLAPFRLLLGCLLVFAMGGCSTVVTGEAERFGRNFALAVQDNDSPDVVAAAMPSYLLLLDALILNNPDVEPLRQAAATLNSVYAGSFEKNAENRKTLNDKALKYAFQSLCLRDKRLCEPRSLKLDELQAILDGKGKGDVSALYVAGSVWAGWVQANSDDWNAVADLSRVEAIMRRVTVLDPAYEHGMPHVYLGVLATVLTPALGGRPDEGRREFEAAIALSGGQNLMAKVYYARNYARGVFDRALHDRLLGEVLAADPHAPGFTLGNMLARREAADLMKSADDYF